jgi:hypothetical protein
MGRFLPKWENSRSMISIGGQNYPFHASTKYNSINNNSDNNNNTS